MRQIHGEGPEAVRGLKPLLAGGSVAALLKLIDGAAAVLPRVALPGSSTGTPTAPILYFVLGPLPLMVASSAILAIRSADSRLRAAVPLWRVIGTSDPCSAGGSGGGALAGHYR